jgi:hypothetical protein
VQKAGAAAKSNEAAELKEALPGLLDSMDKAAAAAEELVETAEREEFSDVGRNADSLRQQILAARNKMSLLQKKL